MLNNIKQIVESPHPIYKRYRNYWDFLLQSYEGGLDYCNASTNMAANAQFTLTVDGKTVQPKISGNLFMHKKELTEDYSERVRMSYYYNFCAPIIDIYSNHLFKDSVIENFEGLNDSTIENVQEDIDRQGSNLTEFRKEVSNMAQVYGHVFVACDVPMANGNIITLKDQIDQRQFPYFVMYHPQNIINWSLDEFGQPYWVLLREELDSNQDIVTFDKNKTTKTQYRLWTRDEWAVFDDDYNLVMTGPHTAGRVPVTCFFDTKSKKARNFLGVSSIADIAYIARDVYNSCSELRQILRDQTFAFLALQGSSDEYKELSVGTSKGLLYPDGRNVPQFVSPPADNANVYFQHIDRQVSKMFQLAKLEGGSASFSGQTAVQESGVSKAWDFNQTNSALAKKASNMEDGELRLWQIFAAQDGTEFTGKIEYPREFSVKDLMSDLNEAEKLFRIQLGKTFDMEVKKAIIKKKFPRKSEQDIEKMEKEIQNIQPEAGMNGNVAGQSIRDKMPFLFKSKNANSAVKGG